VCDARNKFEANIDGASGESSRGMPTNGMGGLESVHHVLHAPGWTMWGPLEQVELCGLLAASVEGNARKCGTSNGAGHRGCMRGAAHCPSRAYNVAS
jgi:hypothetical protein